jgi:hypothetical protein
MHRCPTWYDLPAAVDSPYGLSAQYARQADLHGLSFAASPRATPRRNLAVPPSYLSPRNPGIALTDRVLDVTHRGRNGAYFYISLLFLSFLILPPDFLLYCPISIPIHALRMDLPPLPSAFPPTTGCSCAVEISGCSQIHLHRFCDDTRPPCLAGYAPAIPAIGVCPGSASSSIARVGGMHCDMVDTDFRCTQHRDRAPAVYRARRHAHRDTSHRVTHTLPPYLSRVPSL